MKRILYLSFMIFCFLFLLIGFVFLCNISVEISYLKTNPANHRIVFWISLSLLSILILYTFGTWLKVGRDPIYISVPYHKPPENVSPAFAYYLYNEMVDDKLFSCIILDLIMKGYLERKIIKNGLYPIVILSRKKHKEEYLPKEESLLLEKLFGYSGSCILSRADINLRIRFADLRNLLENYFIIRRNPYVKGNQKYAIIPIILVLALAIIPSAFYSSFLPILINICFVLFFLIITGAIHNPYKKIVAGIVNTILFIAGFGFYIKFYTNIQYSGFSFTQLFLFIGLWIAVFYISLIRNVTTSGRKLFEKLNGFKKYIETAEINRVAASNPLDKERIFCDYLPYAFAMDLHNQWMEKFSKVISYATMEESTASVDIAVMITDTIYSYFKNRNITTAFSSKNNIDRH